MYTGKTKKVRDTIHGYIEIPEIIVTEIIDSELFQRLRYIEQTSMRSLYPAARHDRFIHSLGVYWLGKQAFKSFRKNSEIELKKISSKIIFSKAWWDKQEMLFELACLLHDCAHAPFSHTLEDLYVLRKVPLKQKDYTDFGLKPNCRIAELDYKLLSICAPYDNSFVKDFIKDNGVIELKGAGAPHEKMSSFCIINEYKDSIDRIAEAYGVKLEKDDYVFMVRMIIGCPYTAIGQINSLKNCIISMLNSSSIDVDGLDYIVRDAYMSGIDNFSIDYQRLLNSFTIIPVYRYTDYSCDNLSIDGIWLKESKFSIKDFKSESLKGKIIIEGIDKYEYQKIEAIQDKIDVTNGVYSSNIDSSTRITNLLSGTMQFQESCRLTKSTFSGTILSGCQIVQDTSLKKINKKDLEYILGYDKNSLSIIQSTIEARNHEYLWVYTHPKVLYSSNYLQWELLRDCAKYLCCCVNNPNFNKEKLDFNKCQNCSYCTRKNGKVKATEEDYLLHILGYETYFTSDRRCTGSKLDQRTYSRLSKRGFLFYRTCDDDLIGLFKRIHIENTRRERNKSEKLDRDFKEFFLRNHRKALWKSFIEYDNFMEKYDDKRILSKFCQKVVSQSSIYKNNYGEPDPDDRKIFEKYGIENVLIIKSAVKTKELNANDTFIKFKDQSLRLYDVFDKTIRKEKMTKDFYYIFGNISTELKSSEFKDLINDLTTITQ